MLWNLNRYRFGKLRSTSVSPHGARTLLPRQTQVVGVEGAYRADVGT